MPMANRAGRFRASALDLGLSETGPNNLGTVVVRFALTQELAGDEWQDVQEEALEITAYVYLEKRDHSVNVNAVRQLREAFGWDGANVEWLEDTRPLPDCQVTLEFETYQGRERLKVQWINAYDSEPGGNVPHSTPDLRKRMSTRLGAKLRAIGGGTPAAKPTAKAPSPKPANRPPAPAPAPLPPPTRRTPAAPAPGPTTVDETWVVFCEKGQEAKLPEAQVEANWWTVMQGVCGHQDPERVTPEQWAQIAEKGPEIPF